MAERAPLSEEDRLRIRRGITLEEIRTIRDYVIDAAAENAGANIDVTREVAREVFGTMEAVLGREAVVLSKAKNGLFGKRKIEDVEAEVLIDQQTRMQNEQQQAAEAVRLETLRRQIEQEMAFDQPTNVSSTGWRLVPANPDFTFAEKPEGITQMNTRSLDYIQRDIDGEINNGIIFKVDGIFEAKTDITCGIWDDRSEDTAAIGLLVWGKDAKSWRDRTPSQRVLLRTDNQGNSLSAVVGFQNVNSASKSTYFFKLKGSMGNTTKLDLIPLEIINP